MKKRIFIAVDFPKDVKKIIKSVVRKLSDIDPKIKCINSDNAHITLAFLGSINESEIAKATAIVKLVSKKYSNFFLNLKNIGFFPSVYMPKIAWIGSDENLELLRLQNELIKQLKLSGINIESKIFIPHLTIGRSDSQIKNIEKVRKLEEILKINPIKVTSIDVMESISKKSGPQYKIVFKVNLK